MNAVRVGWVEARDPAHAGGHLRLFRPAPRGANARIWWASCLDPPYVAPDFALSTAKAAPIDLEFSHPRAERVGIDLQKRRGPTPAFNPSPGNPQRRDNVLAHGLGQRQDQGMAW